MGLPSFLFYKNGAEVKRLCGEGINEKDLVDVIHSLMT